LAHESGFSIFGIQTYIDEQQTKLFKFRPKLQRYSSTKTTIPLTSEIVVLKI